MSHRIAIDIDNVTLEFQPYWQELYETWFGVPVIEEYMGEWDAVVDGTHFETSQEFFAWFDRAGGWDDMPWVPGAPGAIEHLAKSNSIVFVTSRSGPAATAATQRWFKRHEDESWPNAQLRVSVMNKTVVPASVYIDDAPHHIDDLFDLDRNVIIFDQPWNQGIEDVLPDGVGRLWRAENWFDVIEIIEEEL